MEPTEAVDWIELVSIVLVVIFIVLVAIGAVLTVWRFIRYKRIKADPPLLLKLNAVERMSLAVPFMLILISRVLVAIGALDPGVFRDQLWWVLVTSIPAILGAAIYVYVEAFVIERGNLPHQWGDPPSAIRRSDEEE